ncbi:MAG: peptidoglycan editing factor PgeF [Microscillaceae bacterium]|nr:peptidoglycan editing factor PgeF [Microscillaceae bacterium]MDW8460458.1 peptidoglycan editing factor PgeF [Cytophagales bacterium]
MNKPFLTADLLLPFAQQVKHFISTRKGGVSLPPYHTLNLGFHVGDSPEHVWQNRNILANAVEIPIANFCFAQQTHSANIHLVTELDRGAGIDKEQTAIADTDALITQEKNICLTVLAADCVLILLFDKRNHAIAAIHAGWRGSLAQITTKTIEAMQMHFRTQSQDLLAVLCPAISLKNYEVSHDFVDRVQSVFGTNESFIWHNPITQKPHLDLHYTNRFQLLKCGVLPQNIATLPYCTFENSDLFFSARKYKNHTGRFAAGICLI